MIYKFNKNRNQIKVKQKMILFKLKQLEIKNLA